MSFHKLLSEKILSREQAADKSGTLKSNGKTVVFTNGVFDILHPGHVDYLCQARDNGDFLFLGLNSDSSVKKLDKEPGRPVNDEKTRALVLAGLACIDAVVIFNEDTPAELIRAIRPLVLVKGGDYTPENIAGADIVKSDGGKVLVIPFLKGYSTTSLIGRIRAQGA